MENIRVSVEAVRQRQQRQWMWQCVSTGLVFGGLGGCVLAMASVIGEGSVPLLWIAAAVIAGPAIGWLWSVLKSRRTSGAATQIDQCCRRCFSQEPAQRSDAGTPRSFSYSC